MLYNRKKDFDWYNYIEWAKVVRNYLYLTNNGNIIIYRMS